MTEVVSQLSKKLSNIEEKLAETGKEKQTQDISHIQVAENDITMDDLRRLEPLQTRVSSYMDSDTVFKGSHTENSTSQGKNITRNPRLSAARRFTRHILWPHQMIHRTGIKDLAFDDLALPEFVDGTCSIIHLPE